MTLVDKELTINISRTSDKILKQEVSDSLDWSYGSFAVITASFSVPTFDLKTFFLIVNSLAYSFLCLVAIDSVFALP